jgi:hypothetical protein
MEDGVDRFIVLRHAQEYFIFIEATPLPMKGCKFQTYARSQDL